MTRDDETQTFLRGLGELVAHTSRRDDLALSWVTSLHDRGLAAKQRAVTFRCGSGKGCAVLEVYPTPQGTVLYRPRRRMSREMSLERSNAAGRTQQTEDGERRYISDAGWLDSDPETTYNVGCNHLDYDLTAERIETAIRSDERTIILPESS
jgi:hypothetical protein